MACVLNQGLLWTIACLHAARVERAPCLGELLLASGHGSPRQPSRLRLWGLADPLQGSVRASCYAWQTRLVVVCAHPVGTR